MNKREEKNDWNVIQNKTKQNLNYLRIRWMCWVWREICIYNLAVKGDEAFCVGNALLYGLASSLSLALQLINQLRVYQNSILKWRCTNNTFILGRITSFHKFFKKLYLLKKRIEVMGLKTIILHLCNSFFGLYMKI